MMRGARLDLIAFAARDAQWRPFRGSTPKEGMVAAAWSTPGLRRPNPACDGMFERRCTESATLEEQRHHVEIAMRLGATC